MADSKVAVVVPMKPLAVAKGRLEGALTKEARGALSLLLLERVLLAARRCPMVAETLVVGGDSTVADAARRLGATWLDDDGAALNDALWLAFSAAFERGMAAALYLPHDLPLITPTEITRVIETSGRLSCLVLAPAFRDGGTNAILAPAHLPLRPSLGAPSFRRHLCSAAASGYPLALYGSLAIGLDLDTEEDLLLSMERDPEFANALRRCGIEPAKRLRPTHVVQ